MHFMTIITSYLFIFELLLISGIKGQLNDTTSSVINEFLLQNICTEQNPPPQNLTQEERLFLEKKRYLCILTKHERQLEEDEKLERSAKFELSENFYLPKNYNKQAAPQSTILQILPNGTRISKKLPVQSFVYLNIRSVSDMDEKKEQITLDLDLMMMWIDGEIVKTLRDKHIKVGTFKEFDVRQLTTMPKSFAEKVWTPDILFEEVQSVQRPLVLEKTGQTLLFNPHLGAMFLRSTMLLTLHCDMSFVYYPADSQKCQFNLRSGSHDSSQLLINWWRNKAYGAYLHETSDPNFDYRITDIREFKRSADFGPETTDDRPNSYLWFEIAMRRKMSYHLLQTYSPSVFFLIVTWLCFLIPSKMLEARVGVAMTTLLTQTSMFSSIRENTPEVGYVKAIDIWMVTCVLFIFLALFAFTVGAWVRHAREQLRLKQLSMQDEGKNLDLMKKESMEKPRRKRVYHAVDRVIECVTVALLSFGFVLFASIYWTWLLVGSEHLRWNVNTTWNGIEE